MNIRCHRIMLGGFRRFYHVNSAEYAVGNTLRPLIYGRCSPQYKVLNCALEKYVPFKGFKDSAIVDAANELGYNSAVLAAIGANNSPAMFNVSTSVQELVKFHLVTKRYGLQEDQEGTKTLEELFLKRLEANKSLGPHLKEVLSILAIPGDFLVNTGLPELFQLADDMIYYSTEKDFNDLAWYSKRLAVSMAYISTELFMAKDSSPNFQATMEFAKGRINQIDEMGTAYNNIEEFAWFQLLTTVNLARSQLVRG
ncbi:ubiquinone biosynthesis protein COQ9 Ecym_4722 [Eremothecium cymbalariae DBVPG|uniref:Ubiquinone biosynthesis protein n=1 Tax=Eremothecium cymbalariae (strain CBS 270.75 / DBVPG 7215 / KCTC 17166 / NRRL Y-17582) TaxID=931890 RepID=G8JSM0_ERECY|nr:hypothetical protein Ecym_4722 [Eremothecium cymbalariae DBVPG\